MASKALIDARIEARRQIVPLTTKDVISRPPQYIHENTGHRPDGTCYGWRANGAIKLWKTRPEEFRLPLKYGMYTYSDITQDTVGDFHDSEGCPVNAIMEIRGSE